MSWHYSTANLCVLTVLNHQIWWTRFTANSLRVLKIIKHATNKFLLAYIFTVCQNLLTCRCLFVFQLFGYFLSWKNQTNIHYWFIIIKICPKMMKSSLSFNSKMLQTHLQHVKVSWHDHYWLSFTFLVK
jgi:hypothetical protein